MAELAAGPHATTDPSERARRQDRLQRVEATFEPLPVDADVAHAYGRVYAATRNPQDFAGLSGLLDVIAV